MDFEKGAKSCLQCGHLLRGRTDKKFCDDGCRSAYNNSRKSEDDQHIRRINQLLKKNRRILLELLPPGSQKTCTTKSLLELMGFVFSFHTHMYINSKGEVYHFCYEIGYLKAEQEQVLILKSELVHPLFSGS